MKEKTVRYYSDELNDDFANNNIVTKELPENYRYYSSNPFYRFAAFVVYRIIAMPAVVLYVKIKYHHRIKNRKVLKKAGKDGYFLYGNHTNGDLDAFVPTMLAFPKKAYIVVGPDTMSIKGIRTLVTMMGAVPLPDSRTQYRHFLDTLSRRTAQGDAVTIYPEAHIWPYYTGIRDFNPASFSYACMNDKPVYCFTNVYIKRKFVKRPKVITYVDGPFYQDKSINIRKNVALFKEKVYNNMLYRVQEHPKYEYKYVYVKK